MAEPENGGTAITVSADGRNFIDFFDNPPPPWVSWAVAVVVVVTLLFRVFDWLYTRRRRNRDIKRQREDEYWFRSVVLAGCLEQIKNFSDRVRGLIEASAGELKSATSNAEKTKIFSHLMYEYRDAQNEAIYGLAELAVFDEKYYRRSVAILEELENSIVQTMGSEVLGSVTARGGLRQIRVQTTKISLLRYLKRIHSELFE